jgi:O-acetyl-ADP-ribose deacetylase (regulator of RNase III)
MKLVLFDLNEGLCCEWASAFFGNDDVKVLNASLDDVVTGQEFQAIVSPANSFGIMDGGIDKPLAEAFPEVQKNVTDVVNELWDGYLPVGAIALADTEDERHPYLIVAPTMPYPQRVINPWIVYDVMRSLLGLADTLAIESIAIPGLATATGGVAPKTAASLMAVAYKHRTGTPATNWAEASVYINEVLMSVANAV